MRGVLCAALLAALGCEREPGTKAEPEPELELELEPAATVGTATREEPRDEGEVGEMGPPLAPSRCGAPDEAAIAHAAVPRGLCAWTWASSLAEPRGMVVSGDDVLVVERGAGRVVALRDSNGDRVVSEDERAVLAEMSGLNHGIAVHGGKLYASSPTTVWRWDYAEGARERLGEPEVVVRGLPDGGHTTRTLVFDREGRLYVNVGSGSNVDRDSRRARVVRFELAAIPSSGIDWGRGEVWADGLRNEVGLAFDARGRLWGVQNGIDMLNRDDLGGDIHADNPAEELNLLAEGGRFHGYPYCWTEYELPSDVGRGRGTQWAHPDFVGDGTHTDAWCRDGTNVVPPRFSLPAHTAPLDLLFWSEGALPESFAGDAIVGMHGSWNRPTPIGYAVVRVRFSDGAPSSVEDLLRSAGEGATGDEWTHRPVDVARGPRGELLVTSDRSGVILAVASPR